jgi:MoaA/NifB/PqqE/SkfB family radical SAM enzyme
MSATPGGPTWLQMAGGIRRFIEARLKGHPTLVNLEVTHRCNARCDFCRYWTTRTEQVLSSYVEPIKRLMPSAVVFTGGEPLLRNDLERLIREIRQAFPAMYLGMVTNGAALTVRRARALRSAGINNITISLDFLDERHDSARGIPGLAKRIREIVPALTSSGIGNLSVQQVIKAENLDSVRSMIAWAEAQGVKVSLSAYTATKSGNRNHCVTSGQTDAVRSLIGEVLGMKRTCRALVSSTYYLQRIPEFFEQGGIGGCPAGRKFVNVDPAGRVHRCSEFEESFHYAEWKPGCFGTTDCCACWVPCRGESQAPITWERVKQVAALYRRPARTNGSGPLRAE